MSQILEELDQILINLKGAQEEGNKKLITQYVREMNELWEANKKEMIENAQKDGFKLDDI
tara:strand:+ start:473 stop:652 length:180 start_codon:yes stop_codon:yes gene_type:complete